MPSFLADQGVKLAAIAQFASAEAEPSLDTRAKVTILVRTHALFRANEPKWCLPLSVAEGNLRHFDNAVPHGRKYSRDRSIKRGRWEVVNESISCNSLAEER